ncbi:hypothetical protein ABH922_000756 [Rhodococcus sp. 27YEA15]
MMRIAPSWRRPTPAKRASPVTHRPRHRRRALRHPAPDRNTLVSDTLRVIILSRAKIRALSRLSGPTQFTAATPSSSVDGNTSFSACNSVMSFAPSFSGVDNPDSNASNREPFTASRSPLTISSSNARCLSNVICSRTTPSTEKVHHARDRSDCREPRELG